SSVGIDNHRIRPLHQGTFQPLIRLFLVRPDVLVYPTIRKGIAKVGNPRHPFTPSQLPGGKMRPERRECRENRNASTALRLDVRAGGPESVVGPSNVQLAWQ